MFRSRILNLVRQHISQAKWWLLAAYLVFLCCAADIRGAVTFSGMLAPFALPAFALLAGLATFSTYHSSRSFQQFDERVASALELWLSRKVVWLVPFIVLTGILSWLAPDRFLKVEAANEFVLIGGALSIFAVTEFLTVFLQRAWISLIVVSI